MALGESLSRLGASGIVLARQRLELAALDVEEELLLAVGLLVRALVAALLGALMLAALAATIVVALWDTSRMAALVGVTLAFAAGTAVAAWTVRSGMHAKPPFLGATLAELAKDRERLSGAGG